MIKPRCKAPKTEAAEPDSENWHCRTKVCPAKPRGSYLYVRAPAARSCSIRHQVLGRLPTQYAVRTSPPLARDEALMSC
jgi:hypothetical protein